MWNMRFENKLKTISKAIHYQNLLYLIAHMIVGNNVTITSDGPLSVKYYLNFAEFFTRWELKLVQWIFE